MDIFSEKNKPIVQMITSSVMNDEIEFDIATKIVLFERKISRLVNDDSNNSYYIGKLYTLRIRYLYHGYVEDQYNFDVVIKSNASVEELARLVGEVSQPLLEIYKNILVETQLNSISLKTL